MPINPIPQPVDVIINPSGEPPKIKDFIINAPLIVQSTNVKNKLDSLDSTSENLSQRVAVLETRPIATASGPSGDYVPTSRTINSYALTADITITKSDLGLANVDNTSDSNKPVSTAQAAADAAVLVSANAYTDAHTHGGGGGLPMATGAGSLLLSVDAGSTYTTLNIPYWAAARTLKVNNAANGYDFAPTLPIFESYGTYRVDNTSLGWSLNALGQTCAFQLYYQGYVQDVRLIEWNGGRAAFGTADNAGFGAMETWIRGTAVYFHDTWNASVPRVAWGAVNGDRSDWSVPVRAGRYTVAGLPTGEEGDTAFATNGRKTGELPGAGTGVPVYYSDSAWRVYSSDAPVTA